jgi:hypothetical protein
MPESRRASAFEPGKRRQARNLRAAQTKLDAGKPVAVTVWPWTRWIGAPADLITPTRLVVPALANATVLMSVYAGLAGLIWGVFDGGITLSSLLARHSGTLRQAADTGALLAARRTDAVWRTCFPLLVPPTTPDGIGLILLDSNADTHFSFTNALGLLSTQQVLDTEAMLDAWPRAGFVIGMHHHLVEYPGATSALSIRIGTALINGSRVVRRLARHADRIVVMHGHRHVDWSGHCGAVRIVSAPSAVMGADDRSPSSFHIQHLQVVESWLALLAPERVDLPPVR